MLRPDFIDAPHGSELKKLPFLSQLAGEISSPASFDPELVREKYLRSSTYAHFKCKGGKPPVDIMAKQITELYIATVLERNRGVNLDKEALLTRISERYVPKFDHDTHGAYLHLRTQEGIVSPTPMTEIDAFGLTIDQNVPFMIEVETSTSNKNARTRISEAISDKRIALLRNIFSKSLSFGCLVVVDPSQVAIESSPIRSNFVQQGGIITPFPFGKDQFLPFVAQIRRTAFN